MDTTTQDVHGGIASAQPDRIRLAWPPPGLESIHDALWPVVRLMLPGAMLFAAPLLLALLDEAPYWSLGPFGQSWWIPIVTSVSALVLLLGASVQLAQLLRGCARGAQLGYSARVMAAVAADYRRDSGFVLQGVRNYASLAAEERALLLSVRVLAPVAYLIAALWTPLALAASAVLGYVQLIEPRGLVLITLVLPSIAIVAAVLANTVEATLFMRAKRAASKPSVEEETRREARSWSANLQLLTEDEAWRAAPPSPSRLRGSSIAVVMPALLLIVPVTAMASLLALGPLMATIAVPNLGSMQSRHAAMAVLRPYRLAPAADITALEAGSALHNLSSIGGQAVPEFMAPFARAHPDPWFAPGETPLGAGVTWAGTIFDRVRSGLSPSELQYLARVAAHPGHREYELAARAATADVAGTRYQMPLPASMNPFELPIPRFGGLREGAYAHVGKAAYELAQGDAVQAEQTIREVISVGLLLTDEGQTLIDALIGMVVADIGGLALENFYRATGRVPEADRLRVARSAAKQAADAARARSGRPSLDQWLRQMPQAVADTAVLRGLRWEQYIMFNSLSPCINLHQAVFGRGVQYSVWLEQAEQALVRHPGDQELFAVGRNGWMRGKADTLDRCGAPMTTLRGML